MENQQYQYLTEKEIKDKLRTLGNPDLTRIADEYASMESIAAAIARTSSIDDFAINYFKENPNKITEMGSKATMVKNNNPTILRLLD